MLETLGTLVWLASCAAIDYGIYLLVDLLCRPVLNAKPDVAAKNVVWRRMCAALGVLSMVVCYVHHTPYILWSLIILTLCVTYRRVISEFILKISPRNLAQGGSALIRKLFSSDTRSGVRQQTPSVNMNRSPQSAFHVPIPAAGTGYNRDNSYYAQQQASRVFSDTSLNYTPPVSNLVRRPLRDGEFALRGSPGDLLKGKYRQELYEPPTNGGHGANLGQKGSSSGYDSTSFADSPSPPFPFSPVEVRYGQQRTSTPMDAATRTRQHQHYEF